MISLPSFDLPYLLSQPWLVVVFAFQIWMLVDAVPPPLLTNQNALAQFELREVLSDDAHAPAFQRKRDRLWVKRAKKAAKQ